MCKILLLAKVEWVIVSGDCNLDLKLSKDEENIVLVSRSLGDSWEVTV